MLTRAVAMIAVSLLSICAHADDIKGAREHFRNGSKAYELGQFDQAISEYQNAYQIRDDPAILYNIAQAHRLAGHAEKALFFYRSYLHRLPDASNNEEVERRINDLVRAVETQKAPPTTAIEAADVAPKIVAPVAEPAAVVLTSPLPRRSTPVYKRWQLWTGISVGVVVIAGAVTLGVLLAPSPQFNPTIHDIGPMSLRF